MCPGGDSIARPAVLENLGAFQDHLTARATKFGIDERRVAMLALALEEIFVNICHYAYPESAGAVILTCKDDGEDFVVEVMDEGLPFDASGLAEPDLTASIEGRRIGGLGWFLVRQVVDELDCKRLDGRNIVRLTLHRYPYAANETTKN
jgi:serine/threonine-protein kinase RsbW